jgi:hypothetical protein
MRLVRRPMVTQSDTTPEPTSLPEVDAELMRLCRVRHQLRQAARQSYTPEVAAKQARCRDHVNRLLGLRHDLANMPDDPDLDGCQ